jgi:hypothetical protein
MGLPGGRTAPPGLAESARLSPCTRTGPISGLPGHPNHPFGGLNPSVTEITQRETHGKRLERRYETALRASSISIRVPNPLAPFPTYSRVIPHAVPAMSTCTQGLSSTNWRRNSAA